MKEHVKIRRQGKFYTAYEKDAYVLHATSGYKISKGRVGFPVNVLGKVQNTLEDKKISYVIIEKDEEVEKKDYKKANQYQKYLERGIKSCEDKKREEDLIEKIKSLPSYKIQKIMEYINEVIYE